MEVAKKFPVYAKLSLIIVGLLGLFYILFIGQDIIIPLIFATLFAILLNPAVDFLYRKGLHRILAISLTLLASMALLFALIYFLSSQIAMFGETIPLLKQKASIIYKDILQWISGNFNIGPKKIDSWVEKTKSQITGINSTVIGQTIGTVGNILVIVLLMPVYIFLILYYKGLILEFISRLFKTGEQSVVGEVLTESKSLIQSYLLGLMIEALIVATLNSVSMVIIGIKYAFLIGIIGALLNIVPYIGGLIATAIPMLLAIALKSPIDAVWVLAAYLTVQFVDNNFIVPMIVASKVKVNALVSIIVVLIGGALWGVAGMFLSIPLTAIIKVVFDRIEPLKPFGYVLGDDTPKEDRGLLNKARKSKKLKRA